MRCVVVVGLAKAFVVSLILLGCTRQHEPPRRTEPAARAGTTAADALAATFAPDVVGTLEPIAPVAGDYAMSLTMTFEQFVTMELRIDERRTGVLRVTLGEDGAATACIGSHRKRASDGQYHYEKDPAKRKHSSSEDVRLLGLGGTWRVDQRVATISFDRESAGTCDLAKATKTDRPPAELRCVGVRATERVPAGSLACEGGESGGLLELGMPMTRASRATPSGRGSPPRGREFMLGAPGLVVEVAQSRNDPLPVVTFRVGAVKLVEKDYAASK